MLFQIMRLKKENFVIPTIDKITEVKWEKECVQCLISKLSEATSNLSFSTPFGCYRFLRMPFGISIAAELFQKYKES